jgi:hypothetical protein
MAGQVPWVAKGQRMIAKRPEEIRMAIHLPRPVAIYFESETARDADALAICFASDATVHDEDRTHEGLAAITAWKIEARRKYEYTAEPLQAVQGDGTTVVTTRLAGNFPGSPLTLTYVFELHHDQITSLEIRS